VERTTGNRTDDWVRDTLKALAKEYFPGRAAQLEGTVRRLAADHERVWKSRPAGSYRPTASMYAVALRWELDKLGPMCSICQGNLVVPTRSAPRSSKGPHLTLVPRVNPASGGLNVPQNLTLCHEGCAAAWTG
jgi:hypothetical protein